MSIRVRFAPSPTGQVHIGNIRAAIFNWLYARHEKGKFILRIEDTDLERSTPEAIATLLDILKWLKIDYDEEPLYQTTQMKKHLAAAKKLLEDGNAYKDNKGDKGEAILFRIPWDAEMVPGVKIAGPQEFKLHPEAPLTISNKGLHYATISKKGKSIPESACLAGFKDLKVLDANQGVLFDIKDHIDAILNKDAVFTLDNADKMQFTRRTVSYDDKVKGIMTKPLDSLKDFVIVRSDGSPIFHLANVIDDITQGITHIIRGDDHVENTFKHIFLFYCLGATLPIYGHLPMIVNAAGKPYSKRDGDAFVGDFRTKGFLPDALFNYLSLLGWSPGDDREKMTREELVEAFTLERCLRASSQMDIQKLTNLNGLYIAEMPLDKFIELARIYSKDESWIKDQSDEMFKTVCAFMQSRVKTMTDVSLWKYFFVEIPDYDENVCKKQFKKPEICDALNKLLPILQKTVPFNAADIEKAIAHVSEQNEIPHGKLNQPLRAAVTGTNIGAGIYETMELLGKKCCCQRLEFAKRFFQ